MAGVVGDSRLNDHSLGAGGCRVVAFVAYAYDFAVEAESKEHFCGGGSRETMRMTR